MARGSSNQNNRRRYGYAILGFCPNESSFFFLFFVPMPHGLFFFAGLHYQKFCSKSVFALEGYNGVPYEVTSLGTKMVHIYRTISSVCPIFSEKLTASPKQPFPSRSARRGGGGCTREPGFELPKRMELEQKLKRKLWEEGGESKYI